MGKAYDPLAANGPGESREHVPSYWAATAGEPPPDARPLKGDLKVDVAVIGAGYTGLGAAYHLAREHGVSVAVLEANQIGWGCSGRNGGFARAAYGRLGHRGWIDQFGIDQARVMFEEAQKGLHHLRALIKSHGIECDLRHGGSLEVAHTGRHVGHLEELHRLLAESFGYQTELLDTAAIAARHYRGTETHAGLFDPNACSVHPLKLAHGVARIARDAGVVLHAGSPVQAIRRDGATRILETPGGRLACRKVVIATNGYTGDRLHSELKARTMPVLSNIIVTRPMKVEEKNASNFVSDAVIHDTRKLRSYYQRLPDDRILMGGRGPLTEVPVEMAVQSEHLLALTRQIFPALSQIDVDFAWGGWVNVTRDCLPHIFRFEDDPAIVTAMGFNGTGVSYSVMAGRRAAQLAMEGECDAPAPLLMPLAKFALPAFRRLGQRALFKLWRYQDSR